MYSKRQQLPLTISNWIDKDVKVKKFTPNLGSMSIDARQNVMLSRQFFSNMTNLSYERNRKITRCDFEKNKFLKNQRIKAETIMPGLLPYIEPLINDLSQDTSSKSTFNKNEPFISSSFQSLTSSSSSNIKSELTFSREQSIKKTKMPQINTTKFSNRQQKSSERIYGLSQITNNHRNSIKQNHVRSNTLVPLTVHDLFGDFNDDSSYESFFPEKPKSAAKDRRFDRLIHLFSDVYEYKSKNYRTVKSIIQSNPALQNDKKQQQQQPISDSVEIKNHQQILPDESYSKTDMDLMDVVA
ncbi:unnamed protein product [Rotaria sp. Silwood1]|nr:unnamed protein product [Rotaria sp. Silwood1]CAF3502092.1 unnamed protein product [Rotaria sp. Silwood1]CAF3617079.1 unnamed protein product [Rotaria sp. Silwood1]CAF4869911.1 unnamed protein product [Rotaria sp. Silwood1]